MRQYERNGITVDQCTECRGVYLDRGELDQLLDAESNQMQMTNSSAYAQPRSDDDYSRNQYGHKKKRRGGFLSDFFDD
jgi:uncharacterized protein